MEPHSVRMRRSPHVRASGLGLVLAASAAAALAQAPEAKDAGRPAQPPPWQRILQGEDVQRVKALEKTIEEREKQGRFADAVAPSKEVLAIRRRAQGEGHWETVTARIEAETAERMAGLAVADQADLASAYRQAEEASAMFRAGRYAEARRIFEKALDIHIRILGDEHPGSASLRNSRAVCLHSQGRYAEAEPLLRKDLAIRRRVLGPDHPDTATSANGLAVTLKAQARCAEAEPFYQEALAIRRRALGEDHALTATSYDNLAGNAYARGRYDEAESFCRRALAIDRRVLGEDDPETAYCFNNLAVIIESQGRYAEAELHHRTALAIRRRALGEDHPLTALSYDRLAVNFASRGRYAEAESLFRQALAIERRALGEDHPETGVCWSNLAGTLVRQGKTAEAESLYRRALAIHRRTLGEGHPETAGTAMSLAAALDDQGKHAEAEPIYRAVVANGRRALGEDHPDTARYYGGLALNLRSLGRYAEAERFDRAALAIRRLALGEDHPDTAVSYDNLTVLLYLQGRDEDAEVMARAAARSYEAARPRISLTGMDRVDFASRKSHGHVLAALLARRGCDVEAWEQWEARLARGLFDDLEARRSQRLTAEERRRREEWANRLGQLDNAIGALAAAPASTDEERRRLEDLKGRRLDVQARLAQLEAELVRKYRVAVGAVYSLEAIQARLAAEAALVGWLDLGSDPGAPNPREDHWACVVRRRGAPRWIRIAGTGADGAWTPRDDTRPGTARSLLGGADRPAWQGPLAELAAQRLGPLEDALAARDGLPAVRHLIVLPSPALAGIPVEAMLEARPAHAPRYLVSYAPSGTLFAWLEERRGEDRDVRTRSRRLLALGDPVPPPAGDSGAPAAQPPEQGLLVQRVGPGSNAERAGIRPGDVLLRYAGAALANRDDLQKRIGAGDPGSGVAVSVWREGRTLELALRPGPLGVALDDRPAAEALGARRAAEALIRRTRGAAFAPLPGSRREVQAIADLFDQREVDVGSSASEQTLASLRDRGELVTFAVIHLATHGEIDDLSPMSSRLLLSQDHLTDPTTAASLDGPVYDGILTAGEVLGTWKLKAELVTLSTCRSGLGRQSGGEGYVGFAQAFFLAGARGLIVSLWEVDDRATSLLMTRFYQNWLGKRPGLSRPLSKAEALNEAKAWLRALTADGVERELASISRGEVRSRPIRPEASHPFAHPHDWAGFVLIGDPD